MRTGGPTGAGVIRGATATGVGDAVGAGVAAGVLALHATAVAQSTSAIATFRMASIIAGTSYSLGR